MSEVTKNTSKQSGVSRFFKKLFGTIGINSKISRQKKVIRQEQNAIVDQYQLIGEKVYTLFVDGADVGEMFEGYCSNVKGSMEKIADCRKNINVLNEEKARL